MADPITLAIIAGSLGAAGLGTSLGGLFSGSGQDPYMALGSASDVEQINPYTDSMFNQLGAQGQNANNLMMQQLRGAQGFQGQAEGALSRLGAFNPTVDYDPMAAQQMFMATSPALQRMAQQAVAPVDMSAVQGQIAQQVANNYQGNPNSGAFLGTMAEQMIQPTMQAELARQQQVSNIFNSLAGQSLSGLQQGTQARAGFQQGANQQRLQAMGQQAQGLGDLAGQNLQGASIFSGLMSNLQGMRSSMAAPEYWQPTYVSNPGYVGPRDWVNFGNNLLGAGMSMMPTGGGGMGS